MFARDIILIGIFACFSLSHALIKKCPNYQQHFEKILGFRPALPTPVKIIHKSYELTPTVINLHCMQLCKNDQNCDSYILNFKKSECYAFTSNERNSENLNFHRADDYELEEDLEVIYFVKTCLNVPIKCLSNPWPLLRIPGASLIGRGYLTINKLLTRRECIERCLYADFICRSVSFQRNNLDNILNKDVMGKCILSKDDKNMQPDSFRVAPLSDEYIENNCQVASYGENELFLDDFCAYEHFPESALMYAEQMFKGLSDRQCQQKCNLEKNFFCKGITFQRSLTTTRCFIHSEDVMSIGPRALISMPDAYYLKRVQCLNLSVRCTQTEMIIRYHPRNYFQGRIYTENHPEDCAIAGSSNGPTFLTLPIDSQRCGVSRAFDFKSPNRTLIYVYIVIQHNPLVQMQSDRYLKVGCISPIMPDKLETSVTVNGKDFDSDGTLVIDRGFECPKLTAYIVDSLTEEFVKEARIGQILKFIISMDSHMKNYDFKVINLTATSEFDRIDLINGNGCPTNPTIFPVLQHEKKENSKLLVTKFKAFKFASSSQIKFNVDIQFCYGDCVPKNCGYGTILHNRKKRSSAEIVNKFPALDKIIFPGESSSPLPAASLESVKFPEPPQKLINGRTDTFGNPLGIQQYFSDGTEISKKKIITLSLDVTLKVLELDTIKDDRFVIGENDQILVGSLASPNKSLCLDESLIIAIIIFWFIFQVLIITGCCIMMQKYRKMRKMAFDDTSSFNNSVEENRHVKWADQRSIHDAYFQ